MCVCVGEFPVEMLCVQHTRRQRVSSRFVAGCEMEEKGNESEGGSLSQAAYQVTTRYEGETELKESDRDYHSCQSIFILCYCYFNTKLQ